MDAVPSALHRPATAPTVQLKAMGSLEEIELTAQRDAAVSLCKGLQEKIRAQTETYEARTEAAEMGRIKAEIELEQLRREESGCAMTTMGQVRTVTAGWLVGVALGWGAGFVLGILFSPALGFMIVLPFVSSGVVGGLIYAQLRDKIRSLRQQTMPGQQGQQKQQQQLEERSNFENKQEFLRQLQGRSDASATYLHMGSDNSTLPSGSFVRRIATAATHVLVRSALDVTTAAAYAMLGIATGGVGGGAGGAGAERAQGR